MTMTPARFVDACRALYGQHWSAPFSRDFAINKRTVKRMAAGTSEIRGDLAAIIEHELGRRKDAIDKLLAGLMSDY